MMSDLRILHVITNLKMGGAERLTIDICNKLSEFPYITVALVLLEKDIEYDLPGTFNIYILRNKCKLSIKNPNSFDNSEFEKIISEFNPHIIHTHLFESEIITRYTLFKDVKYFTHIHDNIRQFKTSYNITKKKNLTELYEKNWIYKRYKKTNNKFISISRDTTFFIKKKLPNKLKKNIFYLPNSIDSKKFLFKEKNDSPQLKLISIGSLVTKKNHRFLVDVVNELIKQKINATLTIIGEGKLKTELQNHINSLQLSHRINLIGNQKDIPKHLQESTIYVHSATYEPFGLVLLEAMASGTPIVTLNGKGNEELIINNENGYIINQQDEFIFASKIIELYNNKEVYSKFQINGIKFCEKYDINIYIDKLLEIYSKN